MPDLRDTGVRINTTGIIVAGPVCEILGNAISVA